MIRTALRLSLPVLALAFLAAPAAAEVFHVQLKNGGVIDTLKQPEQASWDAGIVLLLTEHGNWIGLEQSEIESVVSETAASGFGIPINTTTIAIGWAPNDAEDPNAPKPEGEGSDSPAARAQAEAVQGMYRAQLEQSRYSIQQGVSTEQTQGIPSSLIAPATTPFPPLQ